MARKRGFARIEHRREPPEAGDMQRRGESGQPAKGPRTSSPKARKAPTAQGSTDHSAEQFDRLKRERDEALEQLEATSKVLQVISKSPGKLEPVFQAMLENALRICEAKLGTMYLCDGGALRPVADTQRAPLAYIEARKNKPRLPPAPDGPVGRVLLTKQVVHIADLRTLQSYLEHYLTVVDAVELGGFRTALGVPMLRNSELVGVINIMRQEVRPFTDKQIKLVESFATQAVIAIENARLLSEQRESLQQQTATADVLKVISRSAFDLQLVLNTLTESASRLCEADTGFLRRREGDTYPLVATFGLTEQQRQHFALYSTKPNRGSLFGRAILEGRTIHIPDVLADSEYDRHQVQKVISVRAGLAVPLMREGVPIGVLGLTRLEPRPFTDKQIDLITTFADQAVIAIENARLFDEVQARTRELSESLEQQTATSEVLKVISSSPGELEPVFQAMLENATRICAANFGIMFEYADGAFRALSWLGISPEFAEYLRHPRIWAAETGLGRVALTKAPVHITDARAGRPYEERDPDRMAAVDLGGVRTFVIVPMLKEDQLVGAFSIFRQEVRPYTDKQIELVTNFAAQAVIAIENARLLNELRQRTDDLSESLEQQTATSEVLKIISSSPGELEPVFNGMLANAIRICEARYGVLYLREGDAVRAAATTRNAPPEYVNARKPELILQPPPDGPIRRVIATKQVVQIADLSKLQSYLERHPFTVAAVELGRFRTALGVPMLKDGEVVGSINILRQEIRPFTDKQIELVKNFAAQAVIAIENARLLNELRTRTNELAQSVGELQALGEVSQAVNSTLELETVLTTIVGRAVELSHTDTGAIYVFDAERKEFRLHATHGMSEAMIAAISGQHIGLGHGNVGTATAERRPVQVPDIRNELASPVNEIILREGYRGILAIPLLRPDDIVGALVVRRKTPGEFPQSTIDLLQTFADQSVVAIQNARLYENVETRTRELAKSLEDLRTTQDRLVQTQKLASLGQLTAGIAHEIKNPLNFVNNFSGLSSELIDELQDALSGLSIDQKARAEINELTDTLRGNLDKVIRHGKRADSIVKNMLLHSREGSGEHRVVDINALVEESLNLAWHGARAEKQGFNIMLERSFDPSAGEADVFPQDITRVLLNLISNGFYAATKRKAEVGGGGSEPTLAASTRNLGDRVEIRVRDNGPGIPPEVKEKMFNPFFTTKPAGEGTGLGLSISHDIIVKQHGGSIEVDTQPGEFTEIRVVLPRAAAVLPERS
jgi:two-component system, NtrC family, sensor kinase